VIVDPPAFGIGRGNERVLRLLWPDLFASLLAMKPRTLVLLSNDKAFRARQSFIELVEAGGPPGCAYVIATRRASRSPRG